MSLLTKKQQIEFLKAFIPALEILKQELQLGKSYDQLLVAVATCIGELNTLEQDVVEASVGGK